MHDTKILYTRTRFLHNFEGPARGAAELATNVVPPRALIPWPYCYRLEIQTQSTGK